MALLEHLSPQGVWQPFSPEHRGIVERSVSLRASGFVRLPDIPYEVRWGQNATSAKMPVAPSTGMIQVNTTNGNTRVVRLTKGGSAVLQEASPVDLFSHTDGSGKWEPYDASQCALIAGAMQLQPLGGCVALPDIPFEVRWGAHATSKKMSSAPETGIIQVNIKTENTRVVRKESPPIESPSQPPSESFPDGDAQVTGSSATSYPSLNDVPMGLPMPAPAENEDFSSSENAALTIVPSTLRAGPTVAEMVGRLQRELGFSASGNLIEKVDAAVLALGGDALQQELSSAGLLQKAQRCFQLLGW